MSVPQSYDEQEGAAVRLIALQELAVLSRLKHENIVTYIDSSGLGGIGGCPNVLGIVMELCAGGTLTNRLERGDRTWSEVNKWTQQLASALHYLHNQPKSDTTTRRTPRWGCRCLARGPWTKLSILMSRPLDSLKSVL